MANRRRRARRPAPPAARPARRSPAAAFAALPRAVRWISATIPPLVAMLIALGVLHGAPARSDSVTEGVKNMLDAGTSRIVVTVAARGRDIRAGFRAAGTFDYRAGRGAFTYDFSATPGFETATAIPARIDDHAVYLRFPAGSGVPAARPWVLADFAETDKLLRDASAAGLLPDAVPDVSVLADVGLNDPSTVLNDLQRSGDLEDRGETYVLGVQTHQWTGTVGAPRPGGGRVSATAFIGPDHLVRRLVLAGDGSGGPVATTMDFSDYGVRVDARPPPPEKVTRVSDLVAEILRRG